MTPRLLTPQPPRDQGSTTSSVGYLGSRSGVLAGSHGGSGGPWRPWRPQASLQCRNCAYEVGGAPAQGAVNPPFTVHKPENTSGEHSIGQPADRRDASPWRRRAATSLMN